MNYLGSAYLWAGQFKEAEVYLLRAVNLEICGSERSRCGLSYLFKLYGVQKRVEEAVQAWEQATSLDPLLEATICGFCYRCPHTGTTMTPPNAICGESIPIYVLISIKT